MRDEATQTQVRAADPSQSTWLAANAGSGKTRVLIDRVARLLLEGTQPEKILCLTYTKAAASEMQNRLFKRLGEWAMLPDLPLRKALADLGHEGTIGAGTLAEARRLFARAIETPGGLKIQTIHSFCAALLRRFPIEARLSPEFRELDDRAARLMREEIVEEMAAGDDVAAVDAVAGLVGSDDLEPLITGIVRNSDCFPRGFGLDDALAAVGLPAGFTAAMAVAEAFDGSEGALFARAVPILSSQSKTMVDLAGVLKSVDPAGDPETAFEKLAGVFLYKGSSGPKAEAKLASVPTKKAQEALGEDLAAFQDLMERVAAAQARRHALAAAEQTARLHRFAAAFLDRYDARKAQGGWLDFDDLITRSAALLSDPAVAAWVLFRLDGGIDHILVDEAQDTSPGQWAVIERLAEEFTAGQGARTAPRTIFVVGDMKQSIYSFQGADLGAFQKMRDHFAARFAQGAVRLQEMALEYSFRSSGAILRVVDDTFDERVNRGLGGVLRHRAFHAGLPGRVDLWAPVPKAGKPETENWYDPTDLLADEHETVILARRVASEIRRLIEAGTQIPGADGPRPVHAGDFLILVQRRSALFHEIIRACKIEGLEIAGADRLKIGGELAVRDLAALLRFLSMPEDDLSLAAALRSPFFGWSEAKLYAFAHGRPKGRYLWEELRRRADDAAETLFILKDLRRWADFLRPYELMERVLTRHDGRRRLLARLGAEAEEGIDALLQQAIAYESAEVPSLTGFLVWLEAEEVEIKRRVDSAAKAIRVMTVHGAKGLEAPIVILPDTAIRREDLRDRIYRVDGTAIWATKADESPPVVVTARQDLLDRQREERMRLLYVAMTRAEVWLIVCAAGEVGEGEASWYSLVEQAIEKAGGADHSFVSGEGKRFATGEWPQDAEAPRAPAAAGTDLPGWALSSISAPGNARAALSPSALGGAKALPGEAGQDEETAKMQGTWLHSLLEHLPLWPEGDWADFAWALLGAAEQPATPAEAEAMLAEARRVLASPDLADLLGPDSLAEVEITAAIPELDGRVLHGTIDRLLVTPGLVRAIDYKSNAVVPGRPEEVPEGILRQMGAYAAMLASIYPQRRIETAVFWTREGKLMPLDTDMVRACLRSATIP